MPHSHRAQPRPTTHRRIGQGVMVVVGAGLAAWFGIGALAAPVATAIPAPSLDPELVRRFDAAARAAAEDGVTLEIVSGLRTPSEQQALVDRAVAQYGDLQEARRWVAPAETSAHVAGRALDVGPAEGVAWLALHGAEYGLCTVFDNEPWHVEARVEPGGVCPPTVPDASSLWP